MDFITAIKTCFSKYATFKGRARRSEFWFWYLFTVIVNLIFSWIPFASLLTLALMLPSLAVTIRRLHDIGRSGWWTLLSFVPSLIAISLLIALLGSTFVSIALGGNYDPNEIVNSMNSNIGLLAMYLLSIIITLICSIIFLIMLCQDSKTDENKYGPNPKA